jgi:hypothetical protein
MPSLNCDLLSRQNDARVCRSVANPHLRLAIPSRHPRSVSRYLGGTLLDLFPHCRLAVLSATRHTEVMRRTDELRRLVGPFLSQRPVDSLP